MMSGEQDHLEPVDEPPPKKFPWGPVLLVVVFVGIGILAFWLTSEKKNQKARETMLAVMDQELTAQEAAVKAQREKVTDLSKQLEDMRTRIQLGAVKNGKAAVAEFNQMAAQQRAERDKFAQMAEEYNKKVAQFHQLEQ